MPAKLQVKQEINQTLRRRELLAKYPDAILLKNWLMDQSEALKISEAAVRQRVRRGMIQARTVKISEREIYVIP